MQTMGESGGTRFDFDAAAAASVTCREMRKDITERRERIEVYFSHILDLWVGDASTAYRLQMIDAIKALDKVDQYYWDLLKVFDQDREKLADADKKAEAVAANIEPAVWADIDTGMA